MNKLEFIVELRRISFNLEDISEGIDHKLCFGLKLAKEIADKVWSLQDKLNFTPLKRRQEKEMKTLQTVELNFNVFFNKTITFVLNEEDSKKLIAYLKEGLECQVFFPDYEDE